MALDHLKMQWHSIIRPRRERPAKSTQAQVPYRPLENASSLRLLKVASHGLSYGTLETHTIDKAPRFCALSYT